MVRVRKPIKRRIILVKVWFDTEFIENGKTIDLLSIGMIREDGKTLYIENSEADLTQASFWVRANVFPYMKWSRAETRKNIAQRVRIFSGTDPEFWAYCCSYDWVVLCQLYGKMIDLPIGFPHYCNDLATLATQKNNWNFPPLEEGNKHNALDDAIWCKQAYEYLIGL